MNSEVCVLGLLLGWSRNVLPRQERQEKNARGQRYESMHTIEEEGKATSELSESWR
jgi:hypothetical protein